MGRCACAPTPIPPPPLLQSCSRKHRGESLATGAGEGGGILAQGHRAWGRVRDPLGSDCLTEKGHRIWQWEGDGNHTLNEQARTHWNGRGPLGEVVLLKSARLQGLPETSAGPDRENGAPPHPLPA